MNIKRKIFELDTRCQAAEDGGYLFLKCKKVNAVWDNFLVDDVRLTLLAAPNPILIFEMIHDLLLLMQLQVLLF